MLKVWLVKFSNGEEYHLFGERLDLLNHVYLYDYETGNEVLSFTYLRCLKG